MAKKTLRDVPVASQRVLLRVDFNVPMEGGRITSLARLRASLPTIQYLLRGGAKVLLCSHLGRPGGKPVESLRLQPVCDALQQLLAEPVAYVKDCVGDGVKQAVAALKPGQVLMLENVRFHPGDEKNDPDFARDLASLADLFVQDAFGVVHRAHASTVGVTSFLPSVAGLLLEKEVDMLARVLEHPHRPLVAIMGGAKISDKMAVVENLLTRVDALLIGGGMAATFFKAKGWEVGASRAEEEAVGFAARAMRESEARRVRLLLPSDVVVASAFEASARHKVVQADRVPSGWFVMDIGPATLEAFRQVLGMAGTVFWNGPMGVFEMPAFSQGTRRLAQTLAELKSTTTIVGGGSTAEVVESMGMEDRFSHVSTGGGATLEFLAGQALPGVEALKDQRRG